MNVSPNNREGDLLHLVHDVAHIMRTQFDQHARAWGMTRAQCMILLHLQKCPGMTQNEMAGRCEIEPITVARLVDRLEAGGYVERRSDPSDRRVKRLHLMSPAEPILKRIKDGRDVAVKLLTDGLTPGQCRDAVIVLKHMKIKLTSSEKIFSASHAEDKNT